MKCIVHVYLLNDNFSPEHAEAHFKGEESENNQRYDWEDEFAITSDVTAIVEHVNVAFPLIGQLPDGTDFSHDVEKMFLYEIQSSDADSTYVGASMSILDSYSFDKTENGFEVKMFLKDYEPLSNPIPGIYIASKEFPKALIF